MKSHFCSDSIAYGMSCFAYIPMNDETSCMDTHIGRRKLRVQHKPVTFARNQWWKREREGTPEKFSVKTEHTTAIVPIVIYICNSRKLTGEPIVQYSERLKLNGFSVRGNNAQSSWFAQNFSWKIKFAELYWIIVILIFC